MIVNLCWLMLTFSTFLLLASCQSNKSQPNIKFVPGSAALAQLYQKGRTSYQAGQFETAATQFAQVATADPNHLNALVNWGSALSRSGEPEKALSKLNQALTKEPNNAAILYNLGVVYERLGQHVDAIEHYTQAITRDQTLLSKALQRYLARQRPKLQDTEIGSLNTPTSPSK